MKELVENSAFLGMLISLASYALGSWLKRKTGWGMMNPLLISIILVIAFLLSTGISYDSYMRGAQFISYMLTPATVCLAVPLYQQLQQLRKNWLAVMAGIISGVLSSMVCILLLSILFRLDHTGYVTFLPKSITTAIGMGVIEELGGYVPVGVVVIVLTGVIGNVFAEKFLKLIKVTEPVAKGIAIGSSSHACGTAKAFEIGEVEGAMSSLSIVVCGLLTVVLAPLFAIIM